MTEVKDGSEELAGLGDVPLGEADGLEGNLELIEADLIVIATIGHAETT
jgi:hypothetical protein